MVLRFPVLMVVLKLALSLPHPGVLPNIAELADGVNPINEINLVHGDQFNVNIEMNNHQNNCPCSGCCEPAEVAPAPCTAPCTAEIEEPITSVPAQTTPVSTESPTTQAPTTVAPTTVAPTTVAPTTTDWTYLSCDEENIRNNIYEIYQNISTHTTTRNSSLAFVFDTTGSMGTDLAIVKEGAEKILKASLDSTDNIIQNFVLVAFNDPDVSLVTDTTDPEVFQAGLDTLSVYGGGDCPEMAIGGIEMALEAVLPDSFIYVFTDASAKDKDKLDEVLLLIKMKRAQVIILLSGPNCYEETDTTYETIASTSSGDIFDINKNDVKEILEFVDLTVGSSKQKVNLFSLNVDAPGHSTFGLLVDNTLKYFTVSLTGIAPYIQIIDPEGNDITDTTETIVSLENVKIVGVEEPVPGRYNVTVGSESNYFVRARGDSSIDFQQGFSLAPTTIFEDTSASPIPGITNYIVVKPTELIGFGDLYGMQMIYLNGTIFYDSSLQLVTEYPTYPIYNGSSLIAPEETFHIKVFGCTSSFFPFERFSTTTISAIPLNSSVSKEDYYEGSYDYYERSYDYYEGSYDYYFSLDSFMTWNGTVKSHRKIMKPLPPANLTHFLLHANDIN